MVVIFGLVGPKARPNGVVDGQQVDIPVLDSESFLREESWGETKFDRRSGLMNCRSSHKLDLLGKSGKSKASGE